MRNLVSKQQVTLSGHSGPVSCIAMSVDHSLIASGETSGPGQPADVIVWDFAKKALKFRLSSIHQSNVVALAFSPSGSWLASVGEEEQLVIWDMLTGSALVGTSLGGSVNGLSFSSGNTLITAGRFHLKQWEFVDGRLTSEPVILGSLKREFTCVSGTDKVYCGTRSGDFVELSGPRLSRAGPTFPGGVTCLVVIPKGDLLLGTGGGVVIKIAAGSFRVLAQSIALDGPVTSLSLTADTSCLFVGTGRGKIYWMKTEGLQAELRSACHTSKINQLVFPPGSSSIVGSCAFGSVRLWSTCSGAELLQIELPNVDCFSLAFTRDGKYILSGWSDGKIRAFTPQTGKLAFVVNDAHKDGVTALCGLGDASRIITGGVGGEIRIWLILCRESQELESNLKEHRGRVTAIRIREDDLRAVSSSLDGSIVVWDISNRVRLACLFGEAKIHSLTYSSDYTQIVSVGTDRRLCYFDVFAAGSPIRIMDGSVSGELNLVVRSEETLVTAGSDARVRVWDYDRAELVAECVGHTCSVTAGAASGAILVTGDIHGGIYFWNLH